MAEVHVTNGAAAQLQARLNDPHTVAVLTRLLDRVDTLDRLIDMAEVVADQGPAMIGLMADSVDEVARSGTDLEIILQHALLVANKLQNPKLIDVLTRLLDQTDSLEMAVNLLEQGPGLVGLAVDVLDELQRTAARSGIDVEVLLEKGLDALIKFIGVVESEEFDAVLNSGVFAPQTVGVVGHAGRALVQSYQTEPQQVGPLGLFKMLNDPDVQRALGFLTGFAKQFGQQLNGSSK